MLQQIDWVPLLLFIVMAAISPGPNNIACASMGIRYGYKKTLRFLVGISLGLAVQSGINGLVSTSLIQVIPQIEPVMRVIGAVYILWLAVNTYRNSLDAADDDQPLMGFKQGVFFQLLNFKAVLSSMTIFTTFLNPLAGHTPYILIAAGLLGVRTFTVNSIWTLFGVSIQKLLGKPVLLKIFNIVLALALVYTALDMLGVPEMLFG
jgi:cysteine/O-acetylserine efflux protein